MNIKTVLNRSIYLMLTIVTLSSLGSCQSDIEDNGLSNPNVDASFAITPVPGSANKFTLTAQSTKDALGSKWDLGDGAGMNLGKFTQTIFLPDAGTYTITHGVIGRGGVLSTASKDLVVATPDPIAGNILKGAKLVNAADWAEWTIANPASAASIVFGNKYAHLISTGGGNGIYQAVNVVAGQKYVIDMVISSPGCINTWFEVYCGYSVPVQGSDYSEGGKLRNVNTWAGCGTAPFSGKISVVGCSGGDNKGIFTATQTGVVYLMIRGGANTKADIKITNIEMRPSL
jgi:hypothetical protein